MARTDRRRIPDALPVTAGRIHFIRPLSPEGSIALLNERWPVGRRWAGQYVWATVNTWRRTLSIYHRRSATQPARRVRQYAYPLAEAVVPVRPKFRRPGRRRKVSTML